MKMPRAGEVLDAYVISTERAGRVEVPLTPQGIADCIGSRAFTVLSRFLYTIPLYVVIRDKVPEDAPPSMISAGKMVYGPVVIFGRDDSFRSLTEFECRALGYNTTLEKYQGQCILLLSNVTENPMEWREPHETDEG